MTNRELLRQAVRAGSVDKQALLRTILEGEAVPVRPMSRTGQRGNTPRRHSGYAATVGGWACAAAMLCLMCVGYVNGSITFGGMPRQNAERLVSGAVENSVEDVGDFVDIQGFSTNDTKIYPKTGGSFTDKTAETGGEGQTFNNSTGEKLKTTGGKPGTMLVGGGEQPTAALWDGWVHTNPLPVLPQWSAAAGGTGATSGGWYVTLAPVQSRPKPDKPGNGGSNPDTGGGGEEVTASFLYAVFSAMPAYSPYLPTALPQGFAPLPFVPIYGNTQAEISYSSPPEQGGTVRITLLCPMGFPKTRGASPPTGFHRVTTREDVAAAKLQGMSDDAVQDINEQTYLVLLLELKGQRLRFQGENISFAQAQGMLQSLPALAR